MPVLHWRSCRVIGCIVAAGGICIAHGQQSLEVVCTRQDPLVAKQASGTQNAAETCQQSHLWGRSGCWDSRLRHQGHRAAAPPRRPRPETADGWAPLGTHRLQRGPRSPAAWRRLAPRDASHHDRQQGGLAARAAHRSGRPGRWAAAAAGAQRVRRLAARCLADLRHLLVRRLMRCHLLFCPTCKGKHVRLACQPEADGRMVERRCASQIFSTGCPVLLCLAMRRS